MARTNKSLSQDTTKSQLQSRGYFKAPDCIFDLPISTHAKVVFLFLCRCSDAEGTCFPSLNKISKSCGVSKPTTIKAIKELKAHSIINLKTVEREKFDKNVYKLLVNVAYHPSKGDLPPLSTTFTTLVKEVDPKEYTYKENTHKEGMCVLNNSQLERLEKKWIETFNTTYNRETTEPPRSITENLERVCKRVAEKLPEKNTEEVFRHLAGLIEWYLSANEDSDPSKENRWVYRGERKSSRLANNFEVVWNDYWAVNQPVIEWKPPVADEKEDVSQDNLVKKFESLKWYREYKERKANGHTN